MTTKLNYENQILLEELFNEYCMLMYNRTYPMTDNNLFNYFLDFYKWKFRDEENNLEMYLKNPVKLITKDDFEITGIYCIKGEKLWVEGLMRKYNQYLKDEMDKQNS